MGDSTASEENESKSDNSSRSEFDRHRSAPPVSGTTAPLRISTACLSTLRISLVGKFNNLAYTVTGTGVPFSSL